MKSLVRAPETRPFLLKGVPRMSVTPCRPRWKSTMTDRERFQRQMHYRSVDRCFNMEFGYWNDNFRVWPFFRDAGIAGKGEVGPIQGRVPCSRRDVVPDRHVPGLP